MWAFEHSTLQFCGTVTELAEQAGIETKGMEQVAYLRTASDLASSIYPLSPQHWKLKKREEIGLLTT